VQNPGKTSTVHTILAEARRFLSESVIKGWVCCTWYVVHTKHSRFHRVIGKKLVSILASDKIARFTRRPPLVYAGFVIGAGEGG
jgi:hypothetical protein